MPVTVTFKCYLKVTEVRWGSGNPFTGSTSMSIRYDTIERFFLIEVYFIASCENAKHVKGSILVWLCKMSKIFNKVAYASCWWLVWNLTMHNTLLCISKNGSYFITNQQASDICHIFKLFFCFL